MTIRARHRGAGKAGLLRPALGGLVALASYASAPPARAEHEILQKNNCFACHFVDKRKYGPPFKEVAARYAADAAALDRLAAKIRSGGAGVWGEDIMPPQPQLSEDDARALARYVLSLK